MNDRFRSLLGHALAPTAAGQPKADQLTPAQEATAAAIARQTMSPFCPGRTLSDCPSEYAAEWRRDIRSLLAQGHTPAEVQDELERRAGANLSGSPARGASYWVPITFGLLGVGVLGAVFLRLRKPASPTSEATPEAAAPPSTPSSAVREGSTQAQPPTIDDARLDAELAAEEDDR